MAIARVALPVATSRLFEYWTPGGVDVGPGAIVRVVLGARNVVGVVTELADEASVDRARLLPIDEVLPLPPLPEDVRELCAFVANYYQAPLGLAFALATPPAPGARPHRRRFDTALVLASHARETLRPALGRAKVASVVFEQLDAPDAVLGVEALAALSPAQRRVVQRWVEAGLLVESTDAPALHALNDEQRAASDAIDAVHASFAPFLLEGITGSGKTDVYLSAAARSIERGGQVLVLVPEINLTPQLVSRVRKALPRATTVTLHSSLAHGERVDNWRRAAEGNADVVLGTRLAVFTPLPRLDLIVVDEEHDASYKQNDTVRYHARDAALWRGSRRNVRVLLASATPSLETFANAQAGRYERLRLTRRADPRASPPALHLVAARGSSVEAGISVALLEAIERRLGRGEQSLVFVNRRGFAPALKCVACEWEAGCPRCSARLVTHRVPPTLACHHCGHRERLPAACPACGNVDLLPVGHGTQRLEQMLASRFPAARVERVDSDTTRRRGAFDEVRTRIADNAVDILVGTQMLAKGHDFPRLTLVGVLGADNALYSADFRATERLAALLVQVGGRAGRADLPGEVIVQTDFPTHPLYSALLREDFEAFAQGLLAERKLGGLPPYTHLALLSAEAHARADTEAFLAAANDEARSMAGLIEADVEVFPPVAAPLARRAGFERSQMLMRSTRRGDLNRVLTRLRESLEGSASRKVRWAIDVDPAALA